MALGSLSGVSKVEYDTVVGMGTAVNLAEPREDSPGFTPEVQETPEANGQARYAGKKNTVVYHISDMSKFSALETIMKANTVIYVRVTDLASNTEVYGPAKAKVHQVFASAPGQTAYFVLKLTYFTV